MRTDRFYTKKTCAKVIVNRRGQVIVEYLLIMVLMVAVAALLTKKLVGRSDDDSNQGSIIRSWSRMIKVIGNDLPDCAKQENFSKPNCPN